MTQGGVDPGRQLIRVIRKGSGAAQELPASSDAFVWLRLYQVEMGGLIPPGRRQPLWWTLRRPVRPLTYHGAHRMFERVNRSAGTTATLHSLRHTAAYRMAEDPALPLTDVQAVLGHAQLTTTQIYLTPRKEDVIRRVLAHHAEQTRLAAERGARAGAGLPARDPRGPLRPDRLVSVAVAHADVLSGPHEPLQAAEATEFPPRPLQTRWPATRQPEEELLARLLSPPFVLEQPAKQANTCRGLEAAGRVAGGSGGADLAAALAVERGRRRRRRLATGPRRVARRRMAIDPRIAMRRWSRRCRWLSPLTWSDRRSAGWLVAARPMAGSSSAIWRHLATSRDSLS